MGKDREDLSMTCQGCPALVIKIRSWFTDSKNRHLQFRTSDGYTFTPDLAEYSTLKPNTVELKSNKTTGVGLWFQV
jgi:hypothetical protein